jgi:hypothetical protein
MRLRFVRLFVILACLLAFAAPAFAQKTVHVKEYKRKDGTVVKAHGRKVAGSKPPADNAPAPVAAASSTSTPTPAATPALTTEAPTASAVNAAVMETVYVTKSGDKYHKAGCRYLSKSAIPMSLKEAVSTRSPCSVCKPPTLAR